MDSSVTGASPWNARLVASAMRHAVDPVLAVVFPSACPQCRSALDHPTRGPLCDGCWSALPRHQGPMCACGTPLGGAIAVCGRCRRGLSPFERGFSVGPYVGGLRVLIHELKFRGRRRVAARLAETIVADAGSVGTLADGRRPGPRAAPSTAAAGARVQPVGGPGRGDRAPRGLRVAPAALVRRKETLAQPGLSAAARRLNVAGAFAVRRPTQVFGRVVVLVDDVVTTGATARACAHALRKAGAREVRLLTVARVD